MMQAQTLTNECANNCVEAYFLPADVLLEYQGTPDYRKLMFLFFADVQIRMTATGRMNIARWALRMKSKYFQMMKGA
ncbi:hypothetical protein NIE88_04755 [Sporolactobacillus shoreicorticis]|uniref:Uncharacterized protein n=1 Tax=Sporolactobacillus shoreicorticis TaxID=1923877 RepID=A0ABW5RZD9_9BACL|nr:hypothetical protein [Sporolactobacillus shoreicorticis]MCO7125083.1 hypothetical protein [Sporolactobacillus shoreicorticis]